MVRCPSLLLTVVAVMYGVGFVHAQATIEGLVPQLRPKPASGTPPRYVPLAGKVAPAPGPRAVIYLEGNFPAGAEAKVSVMGQQGYQFTHAVLPVRLGSRVEFPNLDDDYHNVFSLSKARRFDLGRYRKGETPPALVFDRPGVVRLYCEIHQHMRGVILVLDTPHFTTTEEGGRFRLSRLPAGSFHLKAWLDESTVLSLPVQLKAGETFRADFSTALR